MILVVLPSLGSGGAQRATVNLVNALVLAGEQVRLVLLLDHPEVYRVDSRVEITRLKERRFRKTLWPLARLLRQERYARVYSAMWHVNFLVTLALVLAGKRPRKVLVSSLHNNPELIRKTEGTPALVDFYYRRVLGRSRVAICVDPGIKAAVEQRYGARGEQLVAASNIALTDELIEEIATEAESGQPAGLFETGPYILWVGRFCYQKNVDLLVEIVQRSDRQFVIVGEGDEDGKLDPIRELDRVRVFPFQDGIWRFYLDAAALILTSRYEGQGLVLIEAMACGCFPIASDCEYGPRSVIGDGDAGALVPQDDAAAFQDAIEAALQAQADPQQADRLRHAMRARAEQFAEPALVETYRQAIWG